MTFSSPEPASNTTGSTADPRQDPAMRSLYRMSRTAGVGLQDYAAVNVFAVVGLLLGLASVLAIIFADATAMLLLPIAAIVVSVIAFRQVQNSNGTQTGRFLAIAGMLIALGFAGTNVFGRVNNATRERGDRAAIDDLVKKFEAAALAQKWPDAYALFDTRFKETVQPETFERTVGSRIGKPDAAHISGIKLGDRVAFETDANGNRFAMTLLKLTVDPKIEGRQPFEAEEQAEFRQIDGTWQFHTITAWFAAAAPKPGTPNQASPQ